MSEVFTDSAVISSFGKQIEIRRIRIPDLRPNQVLVKILYASICGSQIFEWRGQRDNKKWLPHLFGHEAIGEVVASKDCAIDFKSNERVVLSWLSNGLSPSEAPVYLDENERRINAGSCAVFSRLAVISQDKIFRIPVEIDPKVAPLFGCSIPTGVGMVKEFSQKRFHEPILVRGFGGVGIATSVYLRKLGVQELFVEDLSDERISKARNMGFKIFDSKKGTEKFLEVYDSTGSATSIETSFELLKAKGTLIFASHPPKGQKICIDPFELIQGKRVYGTWGGGISSQKDFNEVVNTLHEEVRPGDFLGKEFRLEEINEAMQYSISAQGGRTLLVCDE